MYSVISGKEQLNHWAMNNPELKEIMSGLSDQEIKDIKRGGFDRKKLYAAFERAVNTKGKPTVILIKTLKGYGLGQRAEGTNTTHQKKKMSDNERLGIAQRLDIPLSEKAIKEAQFFVPDPDSKEMQYLHEQRKRLGGYQPIRFNDCKSVKTPSIEVFQDFGVFS